MREEEEKVKWKVRFFSPKFSRRDNKETLRNLSCFVREFKEIAHLKHVYLARKEKVKKAFLKESKTVFSIATAKKDKQNFVARIITVHSNSLLWFRTENYCFTAPLFFDFPKTFKGAKLDAVKLRYFFDCLKIKKGAKNEIR